MNGTLGRLSMKELPLTERPYERMEKFGPEVLSNAELLAIIIRTGNAKETSVGLAQRVLKMDTENKGLAFLHDISLEELKAIEGIGRVKAIQIKAVMELSKRISTSFASTKKTQVKSPEVIANLLMEDMRYLNKEVFKVVLLNAKNNIIKITDVSVGSLTASIVHPREVFNEAVKSSSYGLIFVHNHPSGDPEPSMQDIETTKRLREAGDILGIKVVDHIIIGDGRFASLKEKGYL